MSNYTEITEKQLLTKARTHAISAKDLFMGVDDEQIYYVDGSINVVLDEIKQDPAYTMDEISIYSFDGYYWGIIN